VAALFTDSVRSAILVHDDWYFYAERYLLGCAGAGAFSSFEQVTVRVGEVLAVVAALPASLVPAQVDHSADDLVARAMALTSLEDGLAFLQGLTSEERDLLAHSDTPLAALADVQTPQEAMARFKTLDPAAKSQLMAQFMRVKDSRRGRWPAVALLLAGCAHGTSALPTDGVRESPADHGERRADPPRPRRIGKWRSQFTDVHVV
jgi:hypothetical protein